MKSEQLEPRPQPRITDFNTMYCTVMVVHIIPSGPALTALRNEQKGTHGIESSNFWQTLLMNTVVNRI